MFLCSMLAAFALPLVFESKNAELFQESLPNGVVRKDFPNGAGLITRVEAWLHFKRRKEYVHCSTGNSRTLDPHRVSVFKSMQCDTVFAPK